MLACNELRRLALLVYVFSNRRQIQRLCNFPDVFHSLTSGAGVLARNRHVTYIANIYHAFRCGDLLATYQAAHPSNKEPRHIELWHVILGAIGDVFDDGDPLIFSCRYEIAAEAQLSFIV